MTLAAAVWLGGVVLSAQLESARIDISYRGDAARVEATYTIAAPGEPVRYIIMRRAGQRIEWRTSDVALSGGDGPYEFTSDAASVSVAYDVIGAGDRVPVPVPSAATDPLANAVEIVARGFVGEPDFADAFPRWEVAEGRAVARPENVPSFVTLGIGPGPSMGRLADAGVIVLVVGATALWWWRRRKAVAR